jgi:hypothetical protein
LLVGRENLKSGKIGNDKIGGGKIRDNKENVEIADCEKFFLNYIDRCAISLHSANLIIDRATAETANIY